MDPQHNLPAMPLEDTSVPQEGTKRESLEQPAFLHVLTCTGASLCGAQVTTEGNSEERLLLFATW